MFNIMENTFNNPLNNVTLSAGLESTALRSIIFSLDSLTNLFFNFSSGFFYINFSDFSELMCIITAGAEEVWTEVKDELSETLHIFYTDIAEDLRILIDQTITINGIQEFTVHASSISGFLASFSFMFINPCNGGSVTVENLVNDVATFFGTTADLYEKGFEDEGLIFLAGFVSNRLSGPALIFFYYLETLASFTTTLSYVMRLFANTIAGVILSHMTINLAVNPEFFLTLEMIPVIVVCSLVLFIETCAGLAQSFVSSMLGSMVHFEE